jgi:hypothetical protein
MRVDSAGVRAACTDDRSIPFRRFSPWFSGVLQCTV